jgi:prepilin-type N-terminal cleavage/methylation domain-containing protein
VKRGAFTLIELMVVIVVLSVAAAISIPNFKSTYAHYRFHQSATDLSGLMRYGQSFSVSRQKIVSLQFEDSFSRARLMLGQEPLSGRFGRVVNFPEDTKVSCPVEIIKFYPDGNMDKTDIEVAWNGKAAIISTRLQKGAIKMLEADYEI